MTSGFNRDDFMKMGKNYLDRVKNLAGPPPTSTDSIHQHSERLREMMNPEKLKAVASQYADRAQQEFSRLKDHYGSLGSERQQKDKTEETPRELPHFESWTED